MVNEKHEAHVCSDIEPDDHDVTYSELNLQTPVHAGRNGGRTEGNVSGENKARREKLL